MSNRTHSFRPNTVCLFFFLLCLLPFLWSCAPLPDMVSNERPEDGGLSADEIRQTTVDQPFMLSGDYFMKRQPVAPSSSARSDDPDHEAASSEAVPATSEQPETASSETARPASTLSASALEAAPTDAPAPQIPAPVKVTPSAPALPIKIGVITDRRNIAPSLASALAQGLRETASLYPVILADQAHINETLTGPVCKGNPGMACMADALSHYPGVRMLFLVESAKADATDIIARISVVDAGLVHQYPIMEIRAPKSDPGAFISIWKNAVSFALSRSRVTPWFCRAFGNDDDTWYLSAGAAAGLKPGDRLRIETPGRVILSPSGMPAGRLPGKVKGELEITALFGTDFAAAGLMTGTAPTGQDILVPAGQ